MTPKHGNRSLNEKWVKCVLIAIGAVIVCMLLACMLITTLMLSGSLDIRYMSLVTSCVILLSMIIGSLWIKSRKGEGRSAAALCYSAAIISLLLLGNLFLNNGHFAGVGIKTLAIIGAIIISLLINGTNYKKAKKRRTKRVVQNANR